ncbi:MAG: hypothetical protein EXS13_06030 [Planctomycetes bacterium]|nr:hypothetical protein [Planctomycetota bacterium]
MDWQDHVVVDLPAPTPATVTNFRHERGYCPHCKKTVRAPRAQDEPPRGHLGIRLLSLASELKSGFGLPFTKVSGLLHGLFNVEVSRSTLASLVQRVGEWLKPACDALLEVVKAAKVKHADETTWPVSGRNGWAWGFATQEVVVFLMEPTRSAKVPQAVLGKDVGSVLVVDEYPGYFSLPHERQTCWAHPLPGGKARAIAGRAMPEGTAHIPAATRGRSDELAQRVPPGRTGDSAPGAGQKGERRKSLADRSACPRRQRKLHPVARALRNVLHRSCAATRHTAGTPTSVDECAICVSEAVRRALTSYFPSSTEVWVATGIFAVGFLPFTLMVKVATPIMLGEFRLRSPWTTSTLPTPPAAA